MTNTPMPCLWFDTHAEEAARFYASIFKNSKIGEISYYGPEASNASGQKPGSVMVVYFELDGQKFMGLNGGPAFKFNEATSFVISCADQNEIDHFWTKLSAGGEPGPCGWLKDKYGVSWQVVPATLPSLISGDQTRANRVMAEVLKMGKLDIATLEKAAKAG